MASLHFLKKEFIINLAGNYLIVNNETGEVSGTAPINRGYQDWSNEVVATVDGNVPRDMEDLVAIIKAASGPRLRIVMESGSVLALDLERAKDQNQSILEAHRVSSDCSLSLK